MSFARRSDGSHRFRGRQGAAVAFTLLLVQAWIGGAHAQAAPVGRNAAGADDAAVFVRPYPLTANDPASYGRPESAVPTPVRLQGLSPEVLASKPARQLFAARHAPARMSPQPLGFYSKGCAAGNVPMELTGDAWQVMRPKRNRYWGQPRLIAFLKDFARKAKREFGWNGLLIGDLSQPRGGPMLTGHASHQIGLDADIWLTEMPDRVLTTRERNTISATLMTLDRKRINPKRFTERHAKLLRMAALYPQVQRIFVHPPIKKFLCDWSARNGERNRRWLAKIRPYYGHNYHFHVRLRCPKDAKSCKDQGDPRPRDGTGCGEHLAWWYSDEPWGGGKARVKLFHEGIPIPRQRPPKPKPRREIMLSDLPRACRFVLLAD